MDNFFTAIVVTFVAILVGSILVIIRRESYTIARGDEWQGIGMCLLVAGVFCQFVFIIDVVLK